MSDAQANEAEKNIEIWKVKKLIKRLEAARGNGTSMISLIIRKTSRRYILYIPSNILCSAKGSGLPCGEDVGRRIRTLPLLLDNCPLYIDSNLDIGYRIEHQVSCESTIRSFCHHVYPTKTEVV